MNSSRRIATFDLLKLFAITLVIIGHVISQYDAAGYGHPVNVWIYSFHMALFMFLSGLFFNHALRKPFKEMLRSKGIQLMLPLVVWSVAGLAFSLLVEVPVDKWGTTLRKYVFSAGILHGLWYLKCLFAYIVVCWAAVRLVKNDWLAAIITTALFLLLPNVNFSSQMILFFWAGHFYGRYSAFLMRRPIITKTSCLLMGGVYC